jgi:hypothetical protein
MVDLNLAVALIILSFGAGYILALIVLVLIVVKGK